MHLINELDLPPLFFCGEDLCNNQGPMVSPTFLREVYLPTVHLSIEPLLDAACASSITAMAMSAR